MSVGGSENKPSRAAEFSYLGKFKSVNKMQEGAILEQYGTKLDTYHFQYKISSAKEEYYCPDKAKRVRRKITLLEAMDKETAVKLEYELDKEIDVHVLFIGNKNPQRPAGYFKTKKSMVRFRDWTLEENNKDSAWGRSLASQYPTKLNKKRYPQYDGDWRRAKAAIMASDNRVSRHMDKLSAFYCRTGLWVPVDWENYESEGLKIMMPTNKKFRELMDIDPEYMRELMKFSKESYARYKRKD
jgi:hypothetical protein